MNSPPVFDLPKDSKLTRVSVEVFDVPGDLSHWVDIPLTNGQLVFRNNLVFGAQTDFPAVPFHVYDVYRQEFVAIPTFSAMEPDSEANPWLIVRNSGFTDDDCPGIADSIEKLLNVIDHLEITWDPPVNPPVTPSPPPPPVSQKHLRSADGPPPSSQKRLRSADGSPEPRRVRPKHEHLSWGGIIDLTVEIGSNVANAHSAVDVIDLTDLD